MEKREVKNKCKLFRCDWMVGLIHSVSVQDKGRVRTQVGMRSEASGEKRKTRGGVEECVKRESWSETGGGGEGSKTGEEGEEDRTAGFNPHAHHDCPSITALSCTGPLRGETLPS